MTTALLPIQRSAFEVSESAGLLRVLHLGAGNLFGGIERALTAIAEQRRLAAEMSPSFGLCFHGRLRDDLLRCGAQVVDLGPVRLSRPWTVFRARRALGQAVRRLGIDVVVTHGLWSHAVFAPCIRKTEASLVHWAHGPFDGRRWLDRLGARTPPDALLANSRFTADSFDGVFPGAPREVVGLPLSTAESGGRDRAAVRRELGTCGDAVVIVMAARIEALKGHAVLLQALSTLSANAKWECWIVGGAQRPEEVRLSDSLHERVRKSGLQDRVRFLGMRRDVTDLLRASDVYCQPNTLPEAFGLSFVEAMQAGLPIVTSRLGGPTEFLDESCAILTPPRDVTAVAEALAQLIERSDFRRTLGRNGIDRARSICDPGERLAVLQRALASMRRTATCN